MQRQGLYTIPSGTGFLKRLADGLLDMAGGDDMALSRMRVLLPTRRAGRELRDAFLSLSNNKPILLPRLQPIGDVDAEEVELYLSGYGITDTDIPPAISALERQFLLSTLVQKKDASLGMDAALSLSNDLARLIDTVHTEDMDFSGLANIVPADLSDHWKETLTFLEIITDAWPNILAERGQIDPADRRNRLLKSLAKLWREQPPETPIIAAGSTGSIPSAGELLKTIASLPKGIVILPNLDLQLDENSWDAITDTHPQATMRNLLNRMEKTRADVRLWPESENTNNKRAKLIRAVMRPAETFGLFADTVDDEALQNLTIIEASSPREEAASIALSIRETLQTPDKTACFVTPDRTLARRVMTALHRWGIEVDDSAGGALAMTRGSTFLVSILRVAEENFAPLALLDFLKHDYQRVIPERDCAEFERVMLRGARPAEGIEGLELRYSRLDNKSTSLEKIMALLKNNFKPILPCRKGQHTLDIFCCALLEVAETFSGGKDFLWTRPESNALSNFMGGVINYAGLIPPLDMMMFGGVFRELLTAENYRADDEPHRRILILGQLESRLIERDVMILGGLNEGTWPRDSGHDPWMSRPMRKKFGLPPAERGVGLAAHDFSDHCAAGEVVITRSLKQDGTATVPARWLQKLRAVLKADNKEQNWADNKTYLQWAKQLDRPENNKPHLAGIPEPCPPQSVRPQKLSATTIEKWMKNPYRIYAEKILKLKLLDAVDMDRTHADRGSFVHDVLMDFVRAYPHQIPPDAKNIILESGKLKLAELETLAPHWHYWWPRFEKIVDWFLDEETKWRKDVTPWLQEETGQLEIYKNEKTGRSFTVTAKADRIDRVKMGGAAILDYKTGAPPPKYKIANGGAPQLPIEALILSKGGYKGQPEQPQSMVYWKLSGSHSVAGEVKPVNIDMNESLHATEEGLSNLVEKFEDHQTPYIARPLGGKLYDDDRAYAHLSRMAEWSNGESGEGEDGEGGEE